MINTGIFRYLGIRGLAADDFTIIENEARGIFFIDLGGLKRGGIPGQGYDAACGITWDVPIPGLGGYRDHKQFHQNDPMTRDGFHLGFHENFSPGNRIGKGWNFQSLLRREARGRF